MDKKEKPDNLNQENTDTSEDTLKNPDNSKEKSKIEESKQEELKDKKTESKEVKTDEKSEKGLLSRFKENPWIVSTIVLGIIAIVLIILYFTGGGITGNVVSSQAAEDNLLSFAESQGLENAEISSVESFNDFFYEATLLMEDQDLPVYITKDGEYMVTEPVPLDSDAQDTPDEKTEPTDTPDENTEPTENTQESSDSETDYSDADLEKLTEFNDCLAENGVVIYGSETCPHCKSLVSMLGGYDLVENVYVECTEEQEKCSEEAETGYVPEIQIDGELYEGDRTIEGFASETGCEVPDLE